MLAGVPHELGLLSELSGLDLGGNKFTGVFPVFLTNLSSLVGFSLAANSFHGSVPEQVGKLSNLQQFGLGDNSFSGELPPALYNLSDIRWLSIFKNQLSGRFSPDISYFFPNIELFIVFENHFTGKIPVSLSNCSYLQEFHISNNGFVGSIPNDLGKLQDLVFLSLWSNRLGARKSDGMLFLSSLTNCSKLEQLNVGSNELSGSTLHVPFANFSKSLDVLLLYDNLIHGPIPSELGNVPSLRRLSLYGNFFTGPIPSELGKLHNLEGMSLSQNRLSGQIPHSLGNLSRLIHLFLTDNHLHGRIPSSIENCTNLLNVLYRNYLGGTIPKQLFNITSLILLDLSHNSLDGNLPSDIGQLQNLNSFNVSHNKLSGGIPGSLGNCKSLVSLDLSFNSFEGSIPVMLEGLSAAEIVDLSSNHLNGSIPSYFIKFSAIQVLNLSFNALRGEVPLKGPFTNASKISVLGNSDLCGGILELHLPPCPKLNVERDHRHKNMRPSLLKIIIVCSIGIIILFLASCYSTVSYWKKRSRKIVQTVLSSSMKKQFMQITYAELHRATNGFSVDNLIGSGSFGSVFKGLLLDSNCQMDIAVKVINNVEQASLRGFVSECEALKKIRHRNVVRILTSCSSLDFQGNDFKALVFKFMKNGSLDSWLHPNSGQELYLSFGKRLDVAIDVANALDYLHNQCETPIIHCDLKPGNILLDEDMVAQVSDFGLAKVLLSAEDNSSSYTSMLKGSIGYIPPEYGERYEVTPEGDVYSYGVLLLEMFMGRRPNHEMFKDGLTISKHAETEHRERLIGIVDPRMMQNENFENHPMLEACFSSIIEVAISCTSNLPQMRKNVSVVCSELQAAKAAYQNWGHGRITLTM